MYGAVGAFQGLALDPFLTMIAAAVVFGVFGYVLQRGFINRFIHRPEHLQMLLMIALAIIIGNGLLLAFGPDARSVQTSYQLDSFELGPLLVDKVRVYAAVAAVVATALLAAFFRFTLTGKAIRACADNPLGARVAGLPVAHLYAVTFGLGAASVAVAGCAMVQLIDVTPGLGPAYTLLAFVIVIVGGLGSMVGALLGGLAIGVSEALAGPPHRPLGEEHGELRSPGGPAAGAAPGPHGTGPQMTSDRPAGAGDRRRLALITAVTVALLALPLVGSSYLVSVATLALYLAYVGQAWNVMMGFAGQLSLGHSLYVGLGAYVAAGIFVHFGVGPWAGLWLAVAICSAVGAFIGLLAFRLRISGVQLSLLTVAFAELARIGFDHLDWFGGPGGLFLRVADRNHVDLLGFPRPAGDVLLRDAGPGGRRARACAPFSCAAAPATTGARSARTRSRPRRWGSTRSAGRCSPWS